MARSAAAADHSVRGIRRRQDPGRSSRASAALVAVAAPAAVSAPSASSTVHGGARVGRAPAAERRPGRSRPRRAPAERQARRGGGPAFARDGRRRLLRPRLVRRDVVLDADREVVSARGLSELDRSARTCSGRRRASIPPAAVAMWMRSPPHRANILNPRLARDRHRRGPQHLGARHLHPSCRSRSSRPTSAFAASSATVSRGARSSVEERRPSKPLVGGSNPPGRTC